MLGFMRSLSQEVIFVIKCSKQKTKKVILDLSILHLLFNAGYIFSGTWKKFMIEAITTDGRAIQMCNHSENPLPVKFAVVSAENNTLFYHQYLGLYHTCRESLR